MNFRKVTPILAIAVTAGLISGCATVKAEQYEVVQEQQEVKQQQEQVYTVKIQNIEGNTLTGVIGEITQVANDGPPALPEGEMQTGEAPPALPEGEMQTGEAPPALPEGEMQTGEAPPALPEGEMQTGEAPPEKPAGEVPGGAGMGTSKVFIESEESITFTISDSTEITVEMLQGIQEGSIESIGVNAVLEVIVNDEHVAQSIIVKNLMTGGGFGGSHTPTHGTSAYTIDSDSSVNGEVYTSEGDDENALRIDGAKVTLKDITVEKTQGESSNTEDGDFYGQNAGFLAMNGAEVTIENAYVDTSVTNGNGIFSYGEGTVVNVSDSSIKTSGNNSGGIQITGGGTMNATNLEVETQGNSAAAIRSDRGGGTVNVVEGSYTTNGTGSPAIYSTADISVKDAELKANQSEAIVIEGKNSVQLENCDLTGNMSGAHLDASENIQNIMIYQSMSGDAEIGHSTFSAKGGKIIAQKGDMIYVTNTTCTIELSDVELTLANDILLRVAGNESTRGWGTQGSNGGQCTFVATNQIMNGKVIVDKISTMDMSLQEGTVFTGSVNEDGAAGEVKVSIDGTSQWVLTGDSYITEFEGNVANIVSNGFTVYVNGQVL